MALRAFEEPELPADVVHLLAQQRDAVGREVGRDGLDVVDAERKVVVAPAPQRFVGCSPGSSPGVGSNSSNWISKRGSAPSSTSVMC